MKRHRGLLIVLFLAGAAVGGLVHHLAESGGREAEALGGQSGSESSGRAVDELAPAEPDPRDAQAADSAPMREPEVESAEPPAEPGRPMTSIQADIHGPHWPEIEAYFIEKGMDDLLERVVEPENIPPPWEEVESQLRGLLAKAIEKERPWIPMKLGAHNGLAWPDPPTKEFLVDQEHLGLTEDNFDESDLERALAETHSLRMDVVRKERELVDAYHEGCLGLLRAKRYTKGAFYYGSDIAKMTEPPELKGRAHWVPTSLKYHVWIVHFQLYKDEHPEIQRLAEELKPLYKQFVWTMKKSLRGRH